jgi:hypothetical protein
MGGGRVRNGSCWKNECRPLDLLHWMYGFVLSGEWSPPKKHASERRHSRALQAVLRIPSRAVGDASCFLHETKSFQRTRLERFAA